MRPNVREFLANGVANFLNRLALSLVLPHRRDWGRALIAEQQEIKSSWERLRWATGGIVMSVKELLRAMFNDWQAGLASAVFGMASALVDLHSSTRWPHIVLLCAFGFALASWRPKWAWRWVVILGLSLPLVVLITNDWGPYSVDRFDVFYGLVPCTVGAFLGLILRSLSSRWLKPAGR
jgi:hypothetical protein